MAERARGTVTRPAVPRMRNYGKTVSSSRQVSWLLGRESLLRLMLSFVLAIALWTYINIKQDPTVAWDYPEALPVATEGLASGLTVANTLGVIHVRIRIGNRNTPVSAASFHPFINLSGLTGGLYPHVPVDVVADPGIRIVGIAPSHLPVALERLAVRHVPVHWRILNGPPHGYDAGNVVVDPSTVTMSGPQSAVDQVADANVYIDLSQAKYSIDGLYKPSPETSSGVTVTGAGRLVMDPQQVHINVPVLAVRGYKSLPLLPPIKGQPKAGYGVVGITVIPSEITAYGPPAVLSRLSTIQTPSISVAHRGAGYFSSRLRLQLPAGISARSRRVTVTVQLAPVAASSSIQAAVVPQNLAPGLAVRTSPASVLVTVVGPASALRQAAGQLKATVNLVGYGAGVYELTPIVATPRGLRVEGISPSTVTLSVSG